MAPADYFNFREENRTFEDFGVWTGDSVTVTGTSIPEQSQGVNVYPRNVECARDSAGARPGIQRQQR